MQNTKHIAKGAIEMLNAQGFEGAQIYLLTKHISRLVPDFSIQQPSVSAKLRACFNNKQGPPSNTGTNSLKQLEKSDQNVDQNLEWKNRSKNLHCE